MKQRCENCMHWTHWLRAKLQINSLFLCLLHCKATHAKERCKQFVAGPRIPNDVLKRIIEKTRAGKEKTCQVVK